ncbi:energy transducer TonB [Tenacibaculum ovolyticum]|uniref:energy transducer TonB n=1 Tax=Tenacibaculum ovolyticum TaxID=104270 RepID=UPI0022F3E3EC|nr:energy transducer TonB [Tenacibaculum ovolyticum]WBX76892.1 energy transducer TonB [Tenacibaculum ovolyticum]
MKSQKKNPRKQLEKFSSIFTQLGLVLVLFIVFVSLEHETEKTAQFYDDSGREIETIFDFSPDIIIEKVKTVVKKPVKVQPVITIVPSVIEKRPEIAPAPIINLPIKNTPTITVGKKKKESKIIKPIEGPVSINNVQNRPIFKGCEGLSEEDNRKCFEKKIKKHVQRYFDAEIAQDLGLRSGKYKIFTQFIIDKSGVISDVKIRAPHKRLTKETNKVVSKIPKFIPGKQNNKPVKVKYTLPITFKVE